MATNKTAGFKTTFGMIAAMAGGAIGLGNIWRFPYMVGMNGGSAFILVYLLFVFVLGMPLMLGEFIIGRRSQANLSNAFEAIGPRYKKWNGVGIISLITCVLVYSFYSVVAGWTLQYIFYSLNGTLHQLTPEMAATVFAQFSQSVWMPLIPLALVLIITAIVVVAGIQKGIERCCKVMTPLLFVLLILLCIRSVTLPGASEGIAFILYPDFSKLTGQAVLSALGQAMLSLSIGMGIGITYGSYTRKEDNLLKTSFAVTAADTTISLLAGFAIFPALFACGLQPQCGPSLVYQVMPLVFNSIPGGLICAFIFFLLLSLAAITSTISLLEIPVSFLVDRLHLKRSVASVVASLIIFTIGVLCSLSFNPDLHFTLGGHSFFDCLDLVTANVFMLLCSLGVTIFVGWVLPKPQVMNELSNEGSIKNRYMNVAYFIIRYIAPLALIIVLINGLLNM